ncbi:alcohol dehydrogenase, putative [Talaromyces stipitatus ATCC 10500]|uniref:Alcohol dehydrogenase, putative n=1 Tax=Talaromyces stipitatus (strain ATCC 10500 / CBS 375.48 / QM 6759 / NRRL 1006) TaxID=441959 RepID=B8M8U5_TALSN|nr:alcohol dehydrogenase, putative [Talaromyces stipitatus ATCC 10500]EED20608.1 alcohol dehydrogenase, putative [Talaromyces stipitatus ATCC 10500]
MSSCAAQLYKMAIDTLAYVVESKDAPFVLRTVVLDDLQPSEVLVEIKYTGLCHTDVVVQEGGMPIGHFPAVLGHEGIGIVKQVGTDVKDKNLKPGDTVILSFRSCGECKACLNDRHGSCPRVTELSFLSTARADGSSPISLPDGTPVHGQFFGQSSLSKMAVVTEKSVVKVPAETSPADLQYLAPFSCGYLTGAGTVLNEFRPDADSTIAIVGMGPVGFAALLTAKAIGVKNLVALDIVDSKLEIAAQLTGARTINNSSGSSTNASGESLSEKILATYPKGIDYILDTSGRAPLLQDSVKALAHGGTLALVGVPPPTATIEVNALNLLTSCKRIIGVIEGSANPKKVIPHLIELFNQGKFPVQQLTKIYPANRLDEAIEDVKRGKVVKVVLSWEGM